MRLLKDLLIGGVYGGLISFLVVATLTLYAYKQVAPELQAASTEVKRAATNVANVTELYAAQLSNPKNQKAIEEGIAVAAAGKGMIRLVNTTTIPKLNDAISTLNDSAARLGVLTSNTDTQINTQVMPALTRTLNSLDADAQAFGVTAETFNTTITDLSRTFQITIAQMNEILTSGEWAQVRANLVKGTAELAETAHQFRLTSEQAPHIAQVLDRIAQLVEQMARTSSRYEKAILLARIFSLVFGAVRPW